MIYITRPVMETHKNVTKVSENFSGNNLKGSKPTELIINDIKKQKADIDYDQDYLRQAIADTNRMLFINSDHFEFRIHEGTGRVMVKLVDNQTDEIIKEIPPEKILDLVASLWDLVGILVDERG